MRAGFSATLVQGGRSGVGQHVLALVRALAAHAREHEFTLFVLEDDWSLFTAVEGSWNIVPVSERFRPPVQNILWHQTVLPGLARRHRLQVLHVPSYRRLLWPRPCALVATIHDLAPFHVPEKYDQARMFYARHVVRLLARRQDRIIAVSQHTAEDITARFGVPPRRITVIHNGIDHGRFFPASRGDARRIATGRYGVRMPFFLYVARLEHPAKNHVRLITAFNQFKLATPTVPWRLVLAGGDWHGASEIHAAIKRSPFARDIHCLGFVDDADLPLLYQAADVFVYPSLYEGFGLPPVEAMACGCPVICSTRGALGEVVGDAAAIVDPENLGSILWQMTRLAADAALREKLQAAGLARARQFDWQKTAKLTLEIYRQAGSKHAEGRSDVVGQAWHGHADMLR